MEETKSTVRISYRYRSLEEARDHRRDRNEEGWVAVESRGLEVTFEKSLDAWVLEEQPQRTSMYLRR